MSDLREKLANLGFAHYSHSGLYYISGDLRDELLAVLDARPQAGWLLEEVGVQLAKAEAKHAPMRGAHEGYAVILEELDELWSEVKRQQIDTAAMRHEALHVAAMALRFVKDVCAREASPTPPAEPKGELMPCCLIIAELATGHGGDVALAEDMIVAAADAGADYAKVQSYSLARLNPVDPQAAWLRQAWLDQAAHERLMHCCDRHRIQFLSTPFDVDSLQMLRELGLHRFKIASSEASRDWWRIDDDESEYFVSWPWGLKEPLDPRVSVRAHLTAIPLYPTPAECVAVAPLLDGWSDHTVGTDACRYQMARGAQVVEVHLTLPGRSREMSWDKSPQQVRELRDWAEVCAAFQTGVSATFRNRWTA